MDRKERGSAIERRRKALGIDSVNKFSARTGIARNTITKAEKGSGSLETLLRLEEWLDQVEAETLPDGVSVVTDPDTEEEVIELTVTGPTTQTEFTFRFKGRASQADSLREQAVRLMLDLDRARGDRD